MVPFSPEDPDGRAEVAFVDRHLLDLQRRRPPDMTAQLRVVPVTEPAPISPVIPCSREARLT